jgi:hypothetical protein
MPYITAEGRTLPSNTGFTLGDFNYPSNWLQCATPEAIESLGLTWVDPPKFKDERWWRNVVRDGEVTSTPIPLEQLKERETRNAKKTAGAMLIGSDWMVIRSVDEEERPVPIEWAEYREAVRAECNRLEEEITAADFEGIQSIEQSWPNDPDFKEIDDSGGVNE